MMPDDQSRCEAWIEGTTILPPHNDEAEQCVLGALLVDNRVFGQISDFLRSEHFYLTIHSKIFEAITSTIENGRIASPITLKEYFERDQSLSDVGGAGYLADLSASVVTVVNAADYAHTIRDHYLRRSLMAMAQDLLSRAGIPTIDATVFDLIDDVERQISCLADDSPRAKSVISLQTAVAEAIDQADAARRRGDGLTGFTTGLKDLDWRTGGLCRGELVILAARPGMGKSDLAFNIAVNAARAGAGVLVFSQEMTATALGMRFLARETGIPASDQRLGRIDDQGFITMTSVDVALPLHIDGTAAVTVEHISRVVKRRRQRKRAVDLVIIDHIQLMSATGLSRLNETAMVTEITGRLKAVSKTLDVAVLALSQLNRAVESREDKRPTLADLRSSGSIEQDADVVMTLYRDEYYAGKEEPQKRPDEGEDKFLGRVRNWERRMGESKNIAEINCIKLRCGPVGVVKVFYDAAQSRFADLARW